MLLLQTYLVISFLFGYRYIIKYIRSCINKLFTVYPININNINQTNCSKHILINNNDSINCVNSDSVNNNEQDQNFVEERKDNENISNCTANSYKDSQNDHNYALLNSYICFLSLNICGLKSKLLIPEFKMNICKYAIICLSESKLDDVDNDFISNEFKQLGYTVFFKKTFYF